MGSIVKLIVLVLFMNFVGFLGIEGYTESTTEIIWCNVVAVGGWIYTIIKGNDE